MTADVLLGASDEYRKHRLKLILWGVEIGIFVAVLVNLFFGTNTVTIAVLTVSGFIIAIAIWELSKGHLDRSVGILLWSLTGLIFTLMWFNSGLRDPAILALSGIMIFAAMLGGRNLFIALFVSMLIYVSVLGLAEEYGWRHTQVAPTGLATVVDIIIVLFIIGYSVRLMALDMGRIVDQLEKENERVLESQDTIKHLAQHDALTGLPNRTLCRDRFIQSAAHGRRNNTRLALLFVDLDNFKTVNDSLGHSAGDELLVEMSNRLLSRVRKVDSVCRFGGDEFLVIVESCINNQGITAIVKDILKVASKPFIVQQQEITLSASVGVTVVPDDGDDFDLLCNRADMAMYKAKESGRNTYRFYSDEMNRQADERFELISGLRNAIKHQEFEVFFQPQIDLRNNRIIGAEALLRWNRAGIGFVSPDEFIPVAEETGLIVDIGRWVLIESCRECKRWHEQGYTDFKIAINLSPVQFIREGIEEILNEVRDEIGLDLEFVELEITESLLVDDSSNTRDQLKDIHKLGVMLAIDDFGTGYSSLSYLGKFNVDILKIDQSFIRSMFNSREDEAIVRVIIQLAQGLGLKVIAEGVEEMPSVEWLRSQGCDYGQGYFWAKPMPAEDFLNFVRSYV